MEKTVIVITADHGEAFGEHGNHWHGRYLYDESVHIPLLIHLPGISGQQNFFSSRSGAYSANNFGCLHQQQGMMDGISLLPLIQRNDPTNFGPVEMVVPDAKFKKHAVVYGPWKYIKNDTDGAEELYHLIQDPGEVINLIGNISR